MKEMDLLLGGFAERELGALNSDELDQFEALLSLPDPDLYAWISGMADIPAEHHSDVMQRLRAFHMQPADDAKDA